MSKKNKEAIKKFHFVEEKEESPKSSYEKDNKVNIKTLLNDSGEDTDTQLFNEREMAIIKENLKDEKENNFFKKLYFGFKFRIGLLLGIALICFILGSFCIVKSLNSTKMEPLQYVENADATYKVCVSTEDPYLTNCVDYSNNIPTKDVNNIQVDFSYLAHFEKEADLNLTYHIEAINRIYDKFDSSKILYENKDMLMEKSPISIHSTIADLDTNFQIDFRKYNDFVVDYQNKYTMSSESSLEVIVYADNGEETYELGTMNIPLGVEKLVVFKNFPKQQEKSMKLLIRDWNDKSTIEIILGCMLMLAGVFAIVNLTKLVLTTISKKTEYERRLSELLTTYDRIIVEARGGYESNIIKKTIKVPTFEDLLDAREILNKPIIFSRVNNIKSEFIVEDDDKLYKYVLKEVDIQKEISNH